MPPPGLKHCSDISLFSSTLLAPSSTRHHLWCNHTDGIVWGKYVTFFCMYMHTRLAFVPFFPFSYFFFQFFFYNDIFENLIYKVPLLSGLKNYFKRRKKILLLFSLSTPLSSLSCSLLSALSPLHSTLFPGPSPLSSCHSYSIGNITQKKCHSAFIRACDRLFQILEKPPHQKIRAWRGAFQNKEEAALQTRGGNVLDPPAYCTTLRPSWVALSVCCCNIQIEQPMRASRW